MMRNYKIYLSVFSMLLFVFSSCSKDNSGEVGGLKGKSSITMEANGKPWKSLYSMMLTTKPEDGEEDYFVSIVGSEVDITDAENGLSNGLTLMLRIPAAKYKNPVGEYDLIAWDDDRVMGGALAWFIQSTNTTTSKIYMPFYSNSADAAPVVGQVKITQFEIGMQQYSNDEGYTKLTGTFSMNLVNVGEDFETFGTEELKLTNGKFDLKSGLDMGNLFGKDRVEMIEKMKRSTLNSIH